MSAFQLNAVSAPPPVTHVAQIQPPKPPKSQSDHKAENPVTSSRGPSVVLSGAVAQGADKSGRQAHADTSGQHVNHVV